MHNILAMVTVTGADDHTSYDDLENLARTYPYAEFGILLSRKQQGNGRFPSREWLKGLAERFTDKERPMLAGHLCGSYVDDILTGRWVFDDIASIHPGLPGIFGRWQINTHGDHAMHSKGFEEVVARLAELDQEVIFQWDGANDAMIKTICRKFPANTSALVDMSHGAGVLPKGWKRPKLDVPVGFAGGLSPDNVIEQMKGVIAAMADLPGEMTWIDAETRLRKNDIFDLGLVEDFLRKAGSFAPNIIEGMVKP